MALRPQNSSRPFMKKTDWLVIFLFLVVSLGLWLLLFPVPGKEEGRVIEIYSDNQLYRSIALPTKEEWIDIPGKPVRLELQNNQIRFYETACPDKTCIRTGFISRTGQTAICLPNRIVVRITGSEADGSQIDGIAG